MQEMTNLILLPVIQYLFNDLGHSEAAGPYVEKLRSGSSQARMMWDGMVSDKSTTYYLPRSGLRA